MTTQIARNELGLWFGTDTTATDLSATLGPIVTMGDGNTGPFQMGGALGDAPKVHAVSYEYRIDADDAFFTTDLTNLDPDTTGWIVRRIGDYGIAFPAVIRDKAGPGDEVRLDPNAAAMVRAAFLMAETGHDAVHGQWHTATGTVSVPAGSVGIKIAASAITRTTDDITLAAGEQCLVGTEQGFN